MRDFDRFDETSRKAKCAAFAAVRGVDVRIRKNGAIFEREGPTVAMRRIGPLNALLFSLSAIACSARQSPPEDSPVEVVEQVEVVPPTAPEQTWPTSRGPRLRIEHPDQLDAVDLASLTHLDLAFSTDDHIGQDQRLSQDQRCARLRLAAVLARAPALETLRISGCQQAIEHSLATVAPRMKTLELADIAFSRGVIDQVSRLPNLTALVLSRVTATEASFAPLHRLRLHSLKLEALERDSPLGDLVGFWPRTLKELTLEGSWAGHNTMLRLPDAKALEELRLTHTRIGNYSLNQIKGLEHLRSVDWTGTTFNDSSPLYFRDLAVERFRCACPRLGDGGIRSLRHSEGLRVIDLPESRVKGSSLVHLAKLDHLEELTILGQDIGIEGFEALTKLRGLRRLALGHVEIEHPDAEGLQQLTNLRELALNFPNLGDEVGPALAPLEALQVLDLSGTRVSDAVLSAVTNKTKLRVLKLHHTRVTNRGLAHLAGLRQLEVLELDHTDVVDDGVAHLADLDRLRELRLDGTLVTDRAVDTLVQLPRLERLNLADTVVSEVGAARLASLPQLRVVNLENTRAQPRVESGLEPDPGAVGPPQE